MEYLAEMIKEVSNTGNTLVLTGRIKNGQLLQELLPGAEFVQGEMKTNDRKDAYKEINKSTQIAWSRCGWSKMSTIRMGRISFRCV